MKKTLCALFSLLVVLVACLVVIGCGGAGTKESLGSTVRATPRLVLGKSLGSAYPDQTLNGRIFGGNENWEIRVVWSDGVNRTGTTGTINVSPGGKVMNLPWYLSRGTSSYGTFTYKAAIKFQNQTWKEDGTFTVTGNP